jgi:hypothetical protein
MAGETTCATDETQRENMESPLLNDLDPLAVDFHGDGSL